MHSTFDDVVDLLDEGNPEGARRLLREEGDTLSNREKEALWREIRRQDGMTSAF